MRGRRGSKCCCDPPPCICTGDFTQFYLTFSGITDWSASVSLAWTVNDTHVINRWAGTECYGTAGVNPISTLSPIDPADLPSCFPVPSTNLQCELTASSNITWRADLLDSGNPSTPLLLRSTLTVFGWYRDCSLAQKLVGYFERWIWEKEIAAVACTAIDEDLTLVSSYEIPDFTGCAEGNLDVSGATCNLVVVS